MDRRRALQCSLTSALLPVGLWSASHGAAAADAAANKQRLLAAMDDMKRPHEVIPLGVGQNIGWKRKPMVAMGTEPYGNAVPSYWRGKRFDEWRVLLPWFVIYEGEPGNVARNVQVEIGGIECWVFTASERRWIEVGAALRPVWDSLYAPNAVDQVAKSAAGRDAEGSMRYSTNAGHMVHGGLGQLPVPWANGRSDVLAMVSAVRHRLVLERPEGPDDRAVANIGVQAGVDYYPWKGARLSDLDASYVPAAGVGRFMRATASWRYSTFFAGKTGKSSDEMLAAEPPAFTF